MVSVKNQASVHHFYVLSFWLNTTAQHVHHVPSDRFISFWSYRLFAFADCIECTKKSSHFRSQTNRLAKIRFWRHVVSIFIPVSHQRNRCTQPTHWVNV